MLIRAKHYANGALVDLTWSDGSVTAIAPATDCRPDHEAGWVAPALFDVQINGCHGRNFSSTALTLEDIRHIIGVCRQHGITTLCPTLITSSFAALAHGFATLRHACESDPEVARAVPGYHLEGPYISAEDGPRGAHAKEHVRPPDWDEWRRLQDAAGGRIRLVTLAPEIPGALRFIENLVTSGIVVALGHTAASGPQIRDAVRAGARLSTHLGNGSHALLPRHDNYLWHQLANDGLWASLITDGDHLPAEVVRCIVRVKTPARLILTCDASPLAGLPQGRHRAWDQDFEVLASGKVVVPGTTYLAGSGVLTDSCINRLLSWGEVGLRDAIDMASSRPRQLLGLPTAALEPGARCDLLLFQWQPGGDFCVDTVLTGGPERYNNGK
jgi:N-acetylglucosamine-6-phosphate deacetylase